ncbi:MAG: cytochrome b [Burkholderiales bacterium]|nr:cytochrome b [Burkholderiales bacterium]MDE1927665.1 cytochrome b [Burkholderiales bacterium]MDE2158082.1 cytochrome b [Burkholderiales bacterium]MDE2504139.1 cytochrome b [Burkholderiales bacterium]
MAGGARYDAVARALHWLLALALMAQIAFGLLLDDIAPRGTPARASVINLHKSIGIVIGLLIVVRLLWRLRHPPPRWPDAMGALARRAATWGHRALYLTMLVLPAAGYLASNFSRHGVHFFGHPLPAWGPDRPDVYAALNGLHEIAAWLLLALIAGHVAFAIKHALIDRDGLFERMGPSLRK